MLLLSFQTDGQRVSIQMGTRFSTWTVSPLPPPPPLSADVIYTECADHRTFIVNFIFLGPFKMKCCFSAADCIVFMTWPTQVSCP